MTQKELFLWSVVYDNQEETEVIAADEWEALDLTQPPRDSIGHRTWHWARAYNITPIVPDYCPIQ
jgi:hypothetical protein